ncbi:MAG: sugar phosphate isomerase/epimerase family protein [Rhodospirillales bacterium]
MIHAISTHLFVNHRLTTAGLERIQNAGITSVEIFCARQHLDYTNRAQVTELKHWFRDSEMQLHSVHAPMYTDDVWGRSGPHAVITITETVKAKRIGMVDEIKRAIELAEHIPFRYLIQHLGVGGEAFDERKLDAAFSSLDELHVFARQRGVEVLLENIPNELSSAERLVYFLNETHLPLGLCLDVGHAHMCEGVETAFELMKDRIRSTHIHDNDGSNDAHLFPTVDGGTVDWKKTMDLLRSRPDQYPLLLELKENPEHKNPLETCMQIFDRLENL